MSTEGSATLAVDVQRDDDAAVVTVDGELEFGTAAALRTTLSDLSREGCHRVVVDLAALRFVDSTGLSLLVQAKQRFESAGHRFELRAPTERVVRVIETSGLAEAFELDAR